MAHVDLCSGIGGFALGFQWAKLSEPVLFCDIEPWSRQILKKHWPHVPIETDVKELANDSTRIIQAIGNRRSILSCGYPCQPFSQAGQRRGSEDDRHIWPEIFSIIQQVRPDWLVCENVSGHISMGLNEVLSDLADKANYAVQTFHLGAVSVDAPHRRMRLWIVARNVGDTKHDGSLTAKIKRSTSPTSEHDAQRQSKTIQLEGASEHRNGGSVEESARTENVGDSKRSRQSRDDGRRSKQEPKNGRKNVADADILNRRADKKSKQSKGRTWRQSPGNSSSDVAYTASTRLQGAEWSEHEGYRKGLTTSSEDVADAQSKRLENVGRRSELGREQDWRRVSSEGSGQTRNDGGQSRSPVCRISNGISYWVDEPGDIKRVSTGVPNRTQRLKGLGNAILPQIAMRIGQTIKAVDDV